MNFGEPVKPVKLECCDKQHFETEAGLVCVRCGRKLWTRGWVPRHRHAPGKSEAYCDNERLCINRAGELLPCGCHSTEVAMDGIHPSKCVQAIGAGLTGLEL